MSDDPTKLLEQIAHYCRVMAEAGYFSRQLDLMRFWQEEMAQPKYADAKCLLKHGFKVYSQADEDGILQEIFRRIGAADRTFVEFGVEAGNECNTVKLLLEGWRGLWIEASSAHAARLRADFPSFLERRQLLVKEAVVTAENIDALLREAGVSGEIDLLSIDIDNNDYWVWRAMSAVSPRVVVIEYNATLRPPLSLVVPYDPGRQWDGSNYFGASLEALVRLGRTKGYKLVGCSFSGANAFFVREDLAGEHFLPSGTAETHYEPPRYFFAGLAAGHRPRPGHFVAA